MAKTEANLDDWRALYEQASAFKERAPWEWLANDDLFAVENPTDGTIGYCSVMGEGGAEFGLALFLGDDGFASYRLLFDDESDPETLEVLQSIHSLSLTFVSRNDLGPNDRRVISKLGLRFRGRNAWPFFRSQRPGYLPWYLERDEVRFLSLALELAIEVSKRVVNGDSSLIVPGGIAERIPTFERRDGAWRQTSRKAPAAPTPEPAPPLDDLQLQRIRQKPPLADAWELGFSPLPTPIAAGGNARPHFPSALLAVSESGLIVGLQMMDHASPAECQAALASALEDAPGCPRQVRVPDEATHRLVWPTTHALRIPVTIGNTPALDAAKDGLFAYLEG